MADRAQQQVDVTNAVTRKLSEAFENDARLRRGISTGTISYLSRRVARRIVRLGYPVDEAIEAATSNLGKVVELLRGSVDERRQASRSRFNQPPRPGRFAQHRSERVPLSEVKRLIEEEHKICGIYPFC